MDTIANGFRYEPKASISTSIKIAARDAAHEAREAYEARLAANREVLGLIAEIEESIDRMKDATDPEFTLVRAKVEASIGAVRQAIFDTGEQMQRHVQGAIEAGDNYVRQRPWEAIGVASAAGLAIGFVLGRR
jgi:ElaB/YqjD/DUF883 family membrane-anchored ribosome-binding protein